jgi:hypothetical protein
MASKRTDSRTLRWKTDFDKNVVVTNFERRGWLKTEGICKLHINSYRSFRSTVLHHKLHFTRFARRGFLCEACLLLFCTACFAGDDWNIYWANVFSVKTVSADCFLRLCINCVLQPLLSKQLQYKPDHLLDASLRLLLTAVQSRDRTETR